jgi:hypothetical protein
MKPGHELFELSMWGGAVERRYRLARPEVEALPWDALDLSTASEATLRAARVAWTEAAFQEHRTGAACALTVKHLIAVRAPIDLVAMASRFALDEMVHVELCARLATAMGGGAPLAYDPKDLVAEPARELSAMLQACELVVRNFCVGESLSIPILRGAWHAARQPLIRAILARIVKDEAAHGAFGWMFLDWAAERLGPADLEHLARQAGLTIDGVLERWSTIDEAHGVDDDERLGWMPPGAYLSLARRSMHEAVLTPLIARGIDPLPHLRRPLPA